MERTGTSRTAGCFTATLLVYAPKAVVRHFHDLTLKRFWRQHFNYGRGACWFHKVSARRQSSEAKVERLSFCAAMLVSVLVLVSQGASAAGMLCEHFFPTPETST